MPITQNRLLCLTDFSPISQNAYRYALDFSKNLSSEITLLHTYESRFRDLLLSRRKRQEVYKQLEQFAHDEAGVIPTSLSFMVRRGKLAESILSVCREGSYRFSVMGKAHTHQAFKKVFGGKTKDLLSRVSCPTLIVPQRAVFQGIHNILVVGERYRSLDESAQAYLLQLSLRCRANLHYVDVHRDPLSWESSQEILSKQQVLIQKSLPESYASESLLEYINDHHIDLLVMMNKRQRLFEDLFSYSQQHDREEQLDLPMLVFHEGFFQSNEPAKRPHEARIPPVEAGEL